MAEEQTLALNGVRLRVRQSGKGDAIVLVHGAWDDRRTWGVLEDQLALNFRVITYDRRGHTDSGDSAEPGTRRDDEDDLAALIERLGLAPANVLGSSFGGSVVLGLAARRPDLFRALGAHEPPLLSLAEGDPLVAAVEEAVVSVLRLIDRQEYRSAARAFVDIALGPGAWEAMPEEQRTTMVTNARTFAGEQRDPAWAAADLDALRDLELPVLLTRGDQSPPFFSKIVTELAGALDRAVVEELPGAGHEPHLTHATGYASAVTHFLAA